MTPLSRTGAPALLALLALLSCGVGGQNYAGASQYWSNQQQPQHPQQPQQLGVTSGYHPPLLQQQPHQQQPQPQPQQPQPQQLGATNGYHPPMLQQQPHQQQPQPQPQQPQQVGASGGYHPPPMQQQQPNQQQPQPQPPGYGQNAALPQQPLQQQPLQQPGYGQGVLPQQPPPPQPQQQQEHGFQQNLPPQQQQQQQPPHGSPPFAADAAETTPSPPTPEPSFQDRLFTALSPGAVGRPGGRTGGILELEPVSNSHRRRLDSQVFQSAGDHALYLVDWSCPHGPQAPSGVMIRGWGGVAPPEFVAVYRLRGASASSVYAADLDGSKHHRYAWDGAGRPSGYRLDNDEIRHYPWDTEKRYGTHRWSSAPRDENYDMLPAGYPMTGHRGVVSGAGLGLHGGNLQYMSRTL